MNFHRLDVPIRPRIFVIFTCHVCVFQWTCSYIAEEPPSPSVNVAGMASVPLATSQLVVGS
jgi:hypothetical protein